MKDLLDIDSQPREEVARWTCHKWNDAATEVACKQRPENVAPAGEWQIGIKT
ncbi:hypothetical protein CA11_29040 [Gimesia maris]|nr:hypothetical protein CA11_29040 [Gimesia maris]